MKPQISTDGCTRRELLWRAGVAGAGLWLLRPELLPAFPDPVGRADEDYWAFADRMQALLDSTWSPSRGAYTLPGGAGETSYNASLLHTHAAAARAGHRGACRQDERARQLVARLCASPPWRPDLPGTSSGC